MAGRFLYSVRRGRSVPGLSDHRFSCPPIGARAGQPFWAVVIDEVVAEVSFCFVLRFRRKAIRIPVRVLTS
jgi:hypothetical protein